MVRGKESAGDAKKRAKKKHATAPGTAGRNRQSAPFELESDTAARRRQARQKQRGESAPQLREQQTLARIKSTEEHARLRLRHRHGADERKRSLHTNGSSTHAPVGAGRQTAPPERHPQTARGAPFNGPSLRAALERQRPQSAKPSRQSSPALSASASELVAGTRIRVRHWEHWLCHPTPTTATQLVASQSSPLLHGGKAGSHGSGLGGRSAGPPRDAAQAAKRTNIVVDMRRLRMLGDADEDEDEGWRPPVAARQAWGGDPAVESVPIV